MRTGQFMSYVVYTITIFTVSEVSGACTFPSSFVNSTWYDNTRGTLTFTKTTMSGWVFTVYSKTLSTWQCVDNSSSTVLVMRSNSSFNYSTISLYAYICLSLTEITARSYYYYQRHAMEPNAGQERVMISDNGSLTKNICNNSITVPDLEFHVLVKTGSESDAAIQLPDIFQFYSDYYYTASNGTVACNNSVDRWDMCTNNSAITFNYSTCSQPIAFSTNGSFWVVANMSASTYECIVVYNRDTGNLKNDSYRFACICFDGFNASVAPRNCTSNQKPTSLPTEADGTTLIGHLLTVQSKHKPCVQVNFTANATVTATTSGLSDGAKVGIAMGIIAAVVLIIAIVLLYTYGKCHTICGRVCNCVEKMPCCKPCCKNKIAEVKKPILRDDMLPQVVTVEETSKSLKLTKEKSMMTTMTRFSSDKRQKSELDKSLIERHVTTTSIGVELKSNWSNGDKNIAVALQPNADGSAPNQPRIKLFPCMLCCPDKKLEESSEHIVAETTVTQTPMKKPETATVKRKSKHQTKTKSAKKGGKRNAKNATSETVNKTPVKDTQAKRGSISKDGTKKPTNMQDELNEGQTEEKPVIKRSKTMPEKENTVLNLQETKKEKVGVHVSNAEVQLDDVETAPTANATSEGPNIEKSKTDFPLTAESAGKRKKGAKEKKTKKEKKRDNGRKAKKLAKTKKKK